MTCPGGCIGGGGQPRLTTNEMREKRIAAIYEEDEHRELRKSHYNSGANALYAEFLGTPLGEMFLALLARGSTTRPQSVSTPRLHGNPERRGSGLQPAPRVGKTVGARP